MRMATASAALALLLLALAAPADAATVTGASRTESGNKSSDVTFFDLTVRGDPAERSDLTVTLSTIPGGNRAEVSDTAAPLVAAGSCRQAGASTVVCDSPHGLGRFTAELGDGDDKLGFAAAAKGFSSVITAGPGDDEIRGGASFDAIDGGGGRDVLRGGGDQDSLTDGDTPGAADADVLDGGPGKDAVSYAKRSGELVIDLSTGQAGEGGEGDHLSGIEAVGAGSGRDVLTGSAANETLDGGPGGPDVVVAGAGADSVNLQQGGRADGGPGNDSILCGAACTADAGAGRDFISGSVGADRLRGGSGPDDVSGNEGDDLVDGGPGDDALSGGFSEVLADGPKRDGHDRIIGGTGNDRLAVSGETDRYDGGPGRDVIVALDRRADRIRCGPGRDRLIGDRRERATGCERRVVGAHVTIPRDQDVVRVEGSRSEFVMELECPEYALVSCRGRLELRAGGELVGRGRYRDGEPSPFVTLNAAGRRVVRRGGLVTVIARGGDATGVIHVTRRKLRFPRG